MEVLVEITYNHIIVHSGVSCEGHTVFCIKSLYFLIEFVVVTKVSLSSGGCDKGVEVVFEFTLKFRH